MNWTTFLQDNSQSLFTLLGVFLGSIITFFISNLNNRFQAKEWEKDRVEQRRDAKTRLTLELRRDDIKSIEEDIDAKLSTITFVQNLWWRKRLGLLPDKEIKAEFISAFLDENSKVSMFARNTVVANKLAHTLGEEFLSEYNHFDSLLIEYLAGLVNSDFDDMDIIRKSHAEVVSSAGKLHNMFREKLILLRDT